MCISDISVSTLPSLGGPGVCILIKMFKSYVQYSPNYVYAANGT